MEKNIICWRWINTVEAKLKVDYFTYIWFTIRTIVKPNKQHISIELPESFVGRQVEVIAFTTDGANKANATVDRLLTHFAGEKVFGERLVES